MLSHGRETSNSNDTHFEWLSLKKMTVLFDFKLISDMQYLITIVRWFVLFSHLHFQTKSFCHWMFLSIWAIHCIGFYRGTPTSTFGAICCSGLANQNHASMVCSSASYCDVHVNHAEKYQTKRKMKKSFQFVCFQRWLVRLISTSCMAFWSHSLQMRQFWQQCRLKFMHNFNQLHTKYTVWHTNTHTVTFYSTATMKLTKLTTHNIKILSKFQSQCEMHIHFERAWHDKAGGNKNVNGEVFFCKNSRTTKALIYFIA